MLLSLKALPTRSVTRRAADVRAFDGGLVLTWHNDQPGIRTDEAGTLLAELWGLIGGLRTQLASAAANGGNPAALPRSAADETNAHAIKALAAALGLGRGQKS